MHKRLWLLAGAAVAMLLVAVSATATTTKVSKGTSASLSAAPFAQAWANVPQTTAGRKAKSVLVFGEEQDVNGFNTNLTCCNQLAGGYLGFNETIRGAYNINNKGVHIKDLVSAASANSKTLHFTIKPKASWYYGGKKLPVTYKDFVYTWKNIVDPKNDVAGRAGYNQISGYSHQGLKGITFKWKKCPAGGSTPDNPCGPYADWQDLFTGVYPSAALAGQDFNKIWTNCICGPSGPVSDGPFYLSNYTKGQGTTLKKNPFWYGKKAGLAEVDFKLVADTNSEVQGMRGGEYDAIAPTFGSNLLPLKSASGITFNQIPGYFQEHIDMQFGKQGQPLLRAPWMRQAIAMGIDRKSIIKAVYGDLAGNTVPLNNILFYSTQASYKADFGKWNYNPTKAKALIAKHCTGSGAPVTCSGLPAKFRYTWTASNATRTNQEAIVKAELKDIGIEITDAALPANVVFGSTGIPSGNYDLANFAWVTNGDPGNFYDTWRCGGDSNYLNYCNRAATRLMDKANGELNPSKRVALYQAADKLMGNNVPTVPLYQRPVPLIYKSAVGGMINNPSTAGPMWNIEAWHWKS